MLAENCMKLPGLSQVCKIGGWITSSQCLNIGCNEAWGKGYWIEIGDRGITTMHCLPTMHCTLGGHCCKLLPPCMDFHFCCESIALWEGRRRKEMVEYDRHYACQCTNEFAGSQVQGIMGRDK